MAELKESVEELDQIPNNLDTITEEINAYQRIAGDAIFKIGRRLKHVRDNPEEYGFEGYRDWERWCDESLGMTRRYANQFIKVVERFGESGFPSLPQSITVLNALTTLTDEQLEQEYELPTGEKKKPAEMSRRQIEELKRQLKAEKEARVAAQERERLAVEKAEKLEQKEPEVRTEYKTEFVEVLPSDYEDLRRENESFRSKFGQGVRRVDERKREELYREFAEELEYIRTKYGSIIFDSVKLQEFGSSNGDYAAKVNAFDDFWKHYASAVLGETKTIIDMEVV